MLNEFSRTGILLGNQAIEKLKKINIAIFGIGGAGSFAAESLARCGIEKITLVDFDLISEKDIEKNIAAMHSTLGTKKTETMKKRILDVNPKAEITVYDMFYDETNADKIILADYDYIIDAMGKVASKIILIVNARNANIPIISCIGKGETFILADINKAIDCPSAEELKRELRFNGIKKLKVVYAKETEDKLNMPTSAGLVITGEVIADLIK